MYIQHIGDTYGGEQTDSSVTVSQVINGDNGNYSNLVSCVINGRYNTITTATSCVVNGENNTLVNATSCVIRGRYNTCSGFNNVDQGCQNDVSSGSSASSSSRATRVSGPIGPIGVRGPSGVSVDKSRLAQPGKYHFAAGCVVNSMVVDDSIDINRDYEGNRNRAPIVARNISYQSHGNPKEAEAPVAKAAKAPRVTIPAFSESEKVVLPDSEPDIFRCDACTENKKNAAFGCGHQYCMPCARTWTDKDGTCPSCRAPITLVIRLY